MSQTMMPPPGQMPPQSPMMGTAGASPSSGLQQPLSRGTPSQDGAPVGGFAAPALNSPVGVPPGATPNPAFAQWMQANQQRQAIIQANQQKQAEFSAACALIRKDGVRGFKLDIEADSTIAPDEQAEQLARTSFLREIVPLIEQVTPIAMGNPAMAEFASEVVMFAVRGFRVARTLEESAEKAFKVLGQMPAPPPKGGAPKEDPRLEQARIAADVHDTQTQAQTDMAETASKTQIAQMTMAQKEQQANAQLAIERDKMAIAEQHNNAQLAIEAEKMRSTERLHTARIEATEARGASGLT